MCVEDDCRIGHNSIGHRDLIHVNIGRLQPLLIVPVPLCLARFVSRISTFRFHFHVLDIQGKLLLLLIELLHHIRNFPVERLLERGLPVRDLDTAVCYDVVIEGHLTNELLFLRRVRKIKAKKVADASRRAVSAIWHDLMLVALFCQACADVMLLGIYDCELFGGLALIGIEQPTCRLVDL